MIQFSKRYFNSKRCAAFYQDHLELLLSDRQTYKDIQTNRPFTLYYADSYCETSWSSSFQGLTIFFAQCKHFPLATYHLQAFPSPILTKARQNIRIDRYSVDYKLLPKSTTTLWGCNVVNVGIRTVYLI